MSRTQRITDSKIQLIPTWDFEIEHKSLKSEVSFEKITNWGRREVPIEAGKVRQPRLEKVTSEASKRLPFEDGESCQ